MWAVTLLSLAGVVLNIFKRQECFIIWSVTNISWMVYDWSIGAKEQSMLFGVYFILSVWGLYRWRSEKKDNGI